MKLVWSEGAEAALAEIEAYVAADDPVAAIRLVDRLIARAETLVDFPALGREAPELRGTGLRELIEGNYRIVYWAGERIEIIAVSERHQPLRANLRPPRPRPRRRRRRR